MNQETPTPKTSPAAWLALALSAAVLIAGTMFPGGLTWGIHAAGRLGAGAAGTCIGILLLGFAVARIAPVRDRPVPRVHPALLVVVAAGAFTLLAWTFRAATQLLGDGQLIVRDFELVRQGSSDILVSSVSSIVRGDFVAPLSSMLHLASVHIGGGTATQSLAAESVLLGTGMTVVVVATLGRTQMTSPLKAWAFVLAFLSPAILLYFGYAENYTAAHLALGLYVILAVRALRNGTRPDAATAILLLATGLHVQALVWWPSAAFLWVTRSDRLRGFAIAHLPWLVSATALVAGLAIAAWIPQDLLLDHGGELSLWSARHGVDLLQVLWLVFPLLPFTIWLRMRNGRSGPGAARIAFADLLVGPAIIYLFLIDPVLGAARDWDRAAFISWALALQTLVALEAGLGSGRYSAEQLRRWLIPAATLCAVATVSWLALNHSPPRSLERVEDVVLADPHAHEHGFEALTRYHSDREQWPAAANWARLAYESSGNPRLATLASQHLRSAGQPDEALAILETAIERRPKDHRVRYELVRLVWETGDYTRTLDIALEGARMHPQESIYPFFAGDCLYRQGRYDDAREELARAMALGDLPEGSQRHAAQLLAKIGAMQTGN